MKAPAFKVGSRTSGNGGSFLGISAAAHGATLRCESDLGMLAERGSEVFLLRLNFCRFRCSDRHCSSVSVPRIRRDSSGSSRSSFSEFKSFEILSDFASWLLVEESRWPSCLDFWSAS